MGTLRRQPSQAVAVQRSQPQAALPRTTKRRISLLLRIPVGTRRSDAALKFTAA
jgi:hypothetical protein